MNSRASPPVPGQRDVPGAVGLGRRRPRAAGPAGSRPGEAPWRESCGETRSRPARRFVPAATDSEHDRPIAPNRLNRQFRQPSPDAAWYSDITYIPTRQGWLYLAVVINPCRRRPVGWSMKTTPRQKRPGCRSLRTSRCSTTDNADAVRLAMQPRSVRGEPELMHFAVSAVRGEGHLFLRAHSPSPTLLRCCRAFLKSK